MVFNFFKASGEERLEQVERQIQQMLSRDRHSFDLAVTALLGGADPAVAGPDLRDTDREVNELEREIRRALVVHLSVQGTVDAPSVLAYMSVVKDIERIGDYAKNIFDLADMGTDLTGAADHEQLHGYARQVSDMISSAGEAFHARDHDASEALISEGDALLDTFDDLVAGLAGSDGIASEAVPRALYYRHLKRIVAHLMNLLSAVVMPLDRLDYFDEDRSTRSDADPAS